FNPPIRLSSRNIPAFYFAENPLYANKYAYRYSEDIRLSYNTSEPGAEGNPNVMPVYLSVRKPFIPGDQSAWEAILPYLQEAVTRYKKGNLSVISDLDGAKEKLDSLMAEKDPIAKLQ